MEKAALGGAWGFSILMIVVMSWLFYRYFAPRSWKEWKGAGLVQAFIIALYAEMYGFPLTIYLLGSVLGIKVPWLHENGHLWSFFIKKGTLAANIEMIVGYIFVFAGFSMIARGWSAVHRATKENRLVKDGIYSVIRHPQYTGIFILIIGQLIHWPTIITLVLSPLILIAYYRLSLKEEKEMLTIFGREYYTYSKGVPMFFPTRRGLKLLISSEASI